MSEPTVSRGDSREGLHMRAYLFLEALDGPGQGCPSRTCPLEGTTAAIATSKSLLQILAASYCR